MVDSPIRPVPLRFGAFTLDAATPDDLPAVLAAFTDPDEGTAMEAWYAHSSGKPVVVYTGGVWAHPWTVYVASSVHDRLEDAVEAIAR